MKDIGEGHWVLLDGLVLKLGKKKGLECGVLELLWSLDLGLLGLLKLLRLLELLTIHRHQVSKPCLSTNG